MSPAEGPAGPNEPPRTLAEQLRGWTDQQLSTLLVTRPDLAVPAPQDSAQLASRATTRSSVLFALDELTTSELRCLSVLVELAPLGLAGLREELSEVDLDAAVRRLRERALVWGTDDALRPVSVLGEVAAQAPDGPLTAPEVAVDERDPALVERSAAGAAYEFTRRTEMLLERWGTAPVSALRGGGLGVRELRAVTTLLRVETAEAAQILETAYAAGLLSIGMSDDLDAAWLPTDAFDLWKAQPAAERWAQLATAWLSNPRMSALIGGRLGDKPVNALAEGLERSWLVRLRRETLTELARLPRGSVLATGTGVASLVARLRWLRPRRPATRESAMSAVLHEAARLGVTGLGGLSGPGRALLEGPGAADGLAASAVLTPLLPESVRHVVLQADLTAVAPGPLEPDVAGSLSLVADIESYGAATVYRFSAASVRRAFDAGWGVAAVHEFVASVSSTPVPQGLSFLIDDVSRRFGVLRAGHAECFLRSDDEAALTELLHQPAATGLRLRRLAPTVLISDVPLAQLLPKLRDLGQAPVVEGPDGTVHITAPEVFRARRPRRPVPPGRSLARSTAHRGAVVAAVRAGDRAAAQRPSQQPVTRPPDIVALLRAVVETGEQVLIGYVGNDGTAAERVVTPRAVQDGRLMAYDARTDDLRQFALHRITAAARTR